jgi:hypothetical protein
MALIPTFCGRDYGRACPPSLSLRRGGRDVVPLSPAGVTDNDWFAFLSQQPGIGEVNFLAAKTTRKNFITRDTGKHITIGGIK